MQEQTDSLINKLILRLRSLANKLERFVAVTEHRMNHRASIWFYDHAKAHYEMFKSLCIYALITPESTAETNRLFGKSTTGQPLRKSAMFGSYWIDEVDSYFQNDIIGNLDREKAKWGKYKQFDVYTMLRKNLNAFFAKEPEEIIKYLKNDIDNADLHGTLSEVDQIYEFVNTAIKKIPQEYWKGETKAFSNSIKRIEPFLTDKVYHAWISTEIKQTILPEIAYIKEVFEFKTHTDDPLKSLLDFIQIDENKITSCLKTMDSRLNEIKQIQSKFYEFCNDLYNQHVRPNFMLREKIDANGARLGLYIDDVVKDLEVFSTKHNWLNLVLNKAKKKLAVVETFKNNYDPKKAAKINEDIAQINEFLCEVKIAKAIIKVETLQATYDYKMGSENNVNKKGTEESDVDFKIDTPDGSILLEVTAPRVSDFVKEHTQHFLMDIGDKSYLASTAAYTETKVHIKAQDVILNKCTKKVCVCHKKTIDKCPDKKGDEDLELALVVEPIKFPVKQDEDATMHAIVIFENDIFGGDGGDYKDAFFYGATPKLPGLLCRNDDAARIFQERIDCVCFVKKTNEVFVYYHPRFNNQKLKLHLEQILSHISNVKQINIGQELNYIAEQMPEARKAHNLSIQKLAEYVNVDVKCIEVLESKKTVTEQKDMAALHKVGKLLNLDRGEE